MRRTRRHAQSVKLPRPAFLRSAMRTTASAGLHCGLTKARLPGRPRRRFGVLAVSTRFARAMSAKAWTIFRKAIENHAAVDIAGKKFGLRSEHSIEPLRP